MAMNTCTLTESIRRKYNLLERPFKGMPKIEKMTIAKTLYIDENLSQTHTMKILNVRGSTYRFFNRYGRDLQKLSEQARMEPTRNYGHNKIDVSSLDSFEWGGNRYFVDGKGIFSYRKNDKTRLDRYEESICYVCNNYMLRKKNAEIKYCSRVCVDIGNSGANNNGWKGGKTIDHQGYVKLSVGGRTIREHRYIFEKILGRRLTPKEVVHHINNKKIDNRPENICLVSHREHLMIHKSLDECIYSLVEIGKIKFNRDTLKYEVAI